MNHVHLIPSQTIMETIQYGKSKYQVFKREETATKFPNIAKHGVVAIITAQHNDVVYQINERAGQKYDRPLRAFEN